jgi:hydroxyacylglutathione hydrolase
MFKTVSEKVYWLEGRNGSSNAFLLLGKEKAVIDPGLKSNLERMEKGLKALNLSFDEIDWVFNTHAHVDHFGLDFAFKKAVKALHEEAAERLEEKDAGHACTDYFPGEECHYPSVEKRLKDGEEVDLGGLRLKVYHTPGHSSGSLCLLEEREGILFSGDTVFKEAWGRTDLESSDKKALIDSLHKIARLKYRILAPGHGPILTENALENVKFLLEMVDG